MTPTQFNAWLNDPTAIRVVLVEATANVSGTDQTFYLSTLPYASQPSDTPANQPYRAVLIADDIETTEQLSLDGSNPTMTVGDVGISNPDGAFDAWFGYVWTNRKIQILLGDVRWARADFQPVCTGVTSDIGSKSRTSVNLKLRDNLERLNVAISEHLLGGTTAQQGALVPLALGEVINVTPLLIDPTNLQYQVHDGQFNGLIEVRDNGVPIANDKLGWAAVTVDLVHGTFQLTSPPAGAITVSLQGDANGGYVNTVAGIVKRVAMTGGYPNSRFTAAEIDTANFTNFDSAHTQPIGISVTGTTNALNVIQQATSSLQAQLTCSRAGQLQLQQIDFASLTPTFDIKPQHMAQQNIWPASRAPVQASVLITYCKNQTQQQNLATSLPAEAISLMSTPYLKATAVDVPTKTLYKLTAEPTEEATALVQRTDANAEAQRRLNNRKVPRTMYQFDGFAPLMQLQMAQHVRLYHPRFNLAAGVPGIVVSMTTRWARGRTTIGVLV